MTPGKFVSRLTALVSQRKQTTVTSASAGPAGTAAVQAREMEVEKLRASELRAKVVAAEDDLAKASRVIAWLTRRHYCDLPLPPEALRLHVGKSTSPFNYQSQGMSSSTRVLEVFGSEPAAPILDWGCGSGRTLRWLLAWPKWRELYRGCDVDAEAIEWLARVRPAAAAYEVKRCNDDPPLPYDDATFGGIFAFSVLTHIHPTRHRAWYGELRRVLKPGGLAYLTTLGPTTLDEKRKKIHSTTEQELEKAGFVYLKNEGHYKDGAVVTESFTRKALEGLLDVEDYVANGYGNMDAFRVRRRG